MESSQTSAPAPIAAAGFNFDNLHRNAMIEKAAASAGSGGAKMASATKTGTTIVGMTFAGGVVLGADTRATGGTEVAEKNCEIRALPAVPKLLKRIAKRFTISRPTCTVAVPEHLPVAQKWTLS
jgi:hypothetical protein